MSKSLKICIAVAAMLAVAAPAMAQVKFSGVFAVQGYHQNFDNSVGALEVQDKKNSRSFIDQRFRPKVDYKLNDYVSLTYFAEIDNVWGGASQVANGGQGGRLSADSINVETKQIFVDFKIPDTTSNVRLGIQALADNYNNVVFFDDMAAVRFAGKVAGMDYRLLYSKWHEGTNNTTPAQFSADDTDLYGFDLGHKYGDFAKAGISVYYLDNKGSGAIGGAAQNQWQHAGPLTQEQIWWVGLNGDYRFANFAIEGWVLYQFGELDFYKTLGPGSDVDTEAWAASVKGRMVIPNGDLGLRYTFFSADDENDEDYKGWLGSRTFGGGHEFADENLMIFFVDRDVMNAGKNRFAMSDAVIGGYGLHAVTATANLKNLPMGTFANLGAGGFWAVDTFTGDDRGGKTLGYEVAAKFGKMFAEKFELSLRGSYAFLGNFYETGPVAQGGNNNDPDDAYMVALMARVPF